MSAVLVEWPLILPFAAPRLQGALLKLLMQQQLIMVRAKSLL